VQEETAVKIAETENDDTHRTE